MVNLLSTSFAFVVIDSISDDSHLPISPPFSFPFLMNEIEHNIKQMR